MKTPAILAGALVLQLMLALGLLWNGLDDSRADTRPLLEFDLAEVDRLVVDDNLGTAEVLREGEGWVLPGLHGLPGADSRIDRVLADLAEVETAFPIATTASALERFEVAEERFQRHVQFFDGDNLLGELYLGTSPGLRQTHIRRGNEDEVYNLPVSSFDYAGDSNDWLDKSLLAAQPARIEGPDFTLEKPADAWTLAAPAEGETLDLAEAGELATALASLRVLRVADSVPEQLAWREYTVESDEGSFGYRLAADEESSRYYVSRDDLEPVFTLAKVDYDRIAKTREQLLVDEEEGGGEEESLDPAEVESGTSPDASVTSGLGKGSSS